jgi:hypothetical protein
MPTLHSFNYGALQKNPPKNLQHLVLHPTKEKRSDVINKFKIDVTSLNAELHACLGKMENISTQYSL